MGVVGEEKDAVAEEGDAALGAFGGVAGDGGGLGAGAEVAPDFAAGAGVEGADLVGCGDVHDAVGDEGGGLEAKVGKGVGPGGLEVGGVAGVDLGEGAVTVAGGEAVVAGPLAGGGLLDALHFGGGGGGNGAGDGAGGDATEGAEVGDEVLALAGVAAEGGHEGGFFEVEFGVVGGGEGDDFAVEGLELEVVLAAAAGEAAEGLAVAEAGGDDGPGVVGAEGPAGAGGAVALAFAGGGVGEGFVELFDGEFAAGGGEVGAVGTALAGDGVAVLALLGEELASGGGVAGGVGVEGGGVPGVDGGGEGVEFGGGEGEGGHAAFGAVADEVANLGEGAGAEGAGVDEIGAAVGAGGGVGVAGGAVFFVGGRGLLG